MYLWIKALHIIFMVCWFAGLFYLPRIFVNIQLSESAEVKAHLNQMALKLYRFMAPFLVLTVFFGVWLAWLNWDYLARAGWFHAKMTLLVLLIGYHFSCGYYRRQLANNRCQKSHLFFRFFNEAPVLVLFAAVILAVLKPF
ncbi:MAG: CopD family protein [Gammaproteobacteria bacterium]|nr:CopD family protein [Gammaproteobacteria bacterium]NVK88490.1 CopD family protein [Gammaproteobacteria bacterium]